MNIIFRNSKFRRITGLLTAVILVLTLSPAEAIVAFADTLTTDGDLTITGDSGGWNYEGDVLTITGGGSYTISGTTTTDRIVISSSEAVEVTAWGLSVTSTDGSPFEITGKGDVNLILSGENVFKSDTTDCAGLQKTETSNTLTISSLSGDDKTDTLTVTSGSGYINVSGATGIGGGSGKDGSNITITGGTVTANGGSGGAGIGGGSSGSGSNITISGGTVSANGSYSAAGIGGGHSGSGENITITGGTVSANGGDLASGIGGGYYGSGENITITGGYITLSRGSDDAAYIGNGAYCYEYEDGTVTITGGYFANGDTSKGTVYDVSVADGCKVISNPITSTKEAYPYVVNNGKPLQITGYADSSDYSYASEGTDGDGNEIRVLKITSGGTYRISMSAGYESTNTDRIAVETTGDVTLTISGINITSSTNSPFRADSGNLTLILEGKNYLKSEVANYPGLTKETTDYTLTITSISGDGETDGSLEAAGGNGGAGIGGGNGQGGSNIEISGGEVTATGNGGAGIGGGTSGIGDNITITGGTVTAASNSGAGIGGGTSGIGSNITISGGEVTATGGHSEDTVSGAGIGGGAFGSGENITITGGYITLSRGSEFAAYIGGGESGSTGTVTITGGYFGMGTAADENSTGTVYETAVASNCKVLANEDTDTKAEYPVYVYAPNAFVITSGDSGALDENSYTYTEGVLTILEGGSYKIAMNTAEGITSTSTDRIVINSTDDVTLTIEKIDVTSTTNSPFRADSGNLTLYLSGDNYLTSTADDYAGLSKAPENKLTIISEGSDPTKSNLTAEGGADGAGIGGDRNVSVSSITVSSATVTAAGAENGAGIGGGYNGSGTNITINGGSVVTATGGTYGAGIGGGKFKHGKDISIDGSDTVVNATGDYAAGIGGGQASDNESIGDNITITDGTVTAVSSRGAGIGGGYSNGTSSTGSNITISGGTVIASSTHETYSGAAIGSGGSYSAVNGIASNISITGGYITLSSASPKSDIIGVGANRGTSSGISITGGYFAVGSTEDGTVYDIAVDSDCEVYANTDSATSAAYPVYVVNNSVKAFVISAADDSQTITENTDYTYTNHILTILQGGSYIIAMNTAEGITSTSTDRIVINSADDVTVTVEAVQITGTTNGGSPFNITGGGDVNLILSGKNIFTSTAGDYAGLQKTTETNTLTISSAGDTVDSLEATGGDYAAGIGGGCAEIEYDDEGNIVSTTGGSGSNITIVSGTITATGGSWAAGIGGGEYGSGSYITIEGGTVEAAGGRSGAGIGGGEWGSGSNITIEGGTVEANGSGEGTLGGASIGGGRGDTGSNITISGGCITLSKESDSAAYIGGGAYGSSTNITITGGYFGSGDLDAQTVYETAVADTYYVYKTINE